MNEVLRYNWNLNWVFMKCIIACVQFHFSEHTVMQMFCDLLDFWFERNIFKNQMMLYKSYRFSNRDGADLQSPFTYASNIEKRERYGTSASILTQSPEWYCRNDFWKLLEYRYCAGFYLSWKNSCCIEQQRSKQFSICIGMCWSTVVRNYLQLLNYCCPTNKFCLFGPY